MGRKEIKAVDLHRSGPEYRKVVEPLYREEAAKTIQSYIRKNSGKRDLIHHFKHLTEPEDGGFNQTLQACVAESRYGDIDYAHPDFTRKLFAALRQDVIDGNELLTIKLLYEGLLAFNQGNMPAEPRTHLKEFKLSDPHGPYNPARDISYWGDQEQQTLQAMLQDPQNDDKLRYYTIDLQPHQTLIFLLAKIQYLNEGGDGRCYDKKIYSFLYAYIKSLDIAELTKQSAIQRISKQQDLAQVPEAFTMIEEIGKKYSQYFAIEKKEKESVFLLASIDAVGSQVPFICISPNYTAKAGSPVLSFIIPTIATFNALQIIAHGVETTIPAPVVGPLTTRMIRAYDEVPVVDRASASTVLNSLMTLYPTTHQLYPLSTGPVLAARPVELTHPDADKTENPHGAECDDFVLSWHDLFHAWRNGSNYKALIRNLRHLHDDKGGFALTKHGIKTLMSKAVWTLTDTDFSQGQFLRDQAKYGGIPDMYKPGLSMELLLQLGGFDRGFSQALPPGVVSEYVPEDNYLLIYSLCKEPEKWDTLLQADMWASPENYHELMKQIKEMQLCLQIHPKASVVQIALSAFLTPGRMGDDELLDQLNAAGLQNILYWSSNHGICFKQKAWQLLPTSNKILRKNDSNTLRKIFKMVVGESRWHEAILHSVATHPIFLTEALNRLSEKERIRALLAQDRNGDTVVHLAVDNPACLRIILRALPNI